MNETLKACIKGVELLEPQYHEKMVIVPILNPGRDSLNYLTLSEALASHHIKITEVDDGGSVPELIVVNSSNSPVLLLDGEELAGAKQNRALNTTILLKKESKTKIPVSCTEQGRWSYVSDEFDDSDVIMNCRGRARKNRSVSSSLESQGQYDSDQGEVWESVEELQSMACADSPTAAMRDVFSKHEDRIAAYLDKFPLQEKQVGLIVIIGSSVVGMDFVSSVAAYKHLHNKLIKSYAMDATFRRGASKSRKLAPDKATLIAQTFMGSLMKMKETKFKSAGHGWDHRFKSAGVVGSSLQYRKTVVHAAFFIIEDDLNDTGHLAGLASRRRYRENQGKEVL